MRPFGLVIVELRVTLDLLDALHHLQVVLEQLDIILLLLVHVQRMILLDRILCQVRFVFRSRYGKMLALLYLNESIQ